jgi:hypothetical protein
MEDTLTFQVVGIITFISLGASVIVAQIIKMKMAARGLIKGLWEFRITMLLFGNVKYMELLERTNDDKVRKLFRTYMTLYRIITTIAVLGLLALIILYYFT